MPRIVETDMSIFDVRAYILVNPVNCEGVMGAGLAKEFAFRYPGMLKDYQKFCKEKKLQAGKLHVWRNGFTTIINLPTKIQWSRPSSYQLVQSGMKELVKVLSKEQHRVVAIPRLGCGLGGLQWGTVKEIILREIEILPDDYIVYLFGEG